MLSFFGSVFWTFNNATAAKSFLLSIERVFSLLWDLSMENICLILGMGTCLFGMDPVFI